MRQKGARLRDVADELWVVGQFEFPLIVSRLGRFKLPRYRVLLVAASVNRNFRENSESEWMRAGAASPGLTLQRGIGLMRGRMKIGEGQRMGRRETRDYMDSRECGAGRSTNFTQGNANPVCRWKDHNGRVSAWLRCCDCDGLVKK